MPSFRGTAAFPPGQARANMIFPGETDLFIETDTLVVVRCTELVCLA